VNSATATDLSTDATGEALDQLVAAIGALPCADAVEQVSRHGALVPESSVQLGEYRGLPVAPATCVLGIGHGRATLGGGDALVAAAV